MNCVYLGIQTGGSQRHFSHLQTNLPHLGPDNEHTGVISLDGTY